MPLSYYKNQMSKFYLEENVENVISSIILKSPKLQTDLLYLRTLFIDSSQSLVNQIDKITKKYQKAKQKLKIYPTEHSETALPITDNNFISDKLKHQRLKSPLNHEKTPKITQNNYDFSPNLMSLILTQAKSIKTIFDSVIKGQPESSKHVQTSKLHNLHTIYKEFYKSFKQKHNEYVENYSYDEKHIHKNSTAMKHRLLEQLKAETLRRKQLQQNIQALQEMMERSLQHKDRQLQKLNLKIVTLIKNNSTKANKVFSSENCNNPMTVHEEQSQQVSLEKGKLRHTSKQEDDIILGSVSRQKQSQFYKISDNHTNNHQIIQSQQYFQQKSCRSSQFSSSDSSEDQQKCKSSVEKIKTKKPNLGKFYNGNDTLITGKINETQSEINHNSKASIHAQKNNQKDHTNQGQKKNPQHNQQRFTFGTQPAQFTNQIQANDSRIQGKKRQSSELFQKTLQDQISSLKQDLKREKDAKSQLQRKLKQNQGEYRKLETEVNELYKMINDTKGNQTKRVENSWTYKNSQTNNYNFEKENQGKREENKKKDNSPNKSFMSKNQNQYTNKNKKMDDFDDCDDYQEIINKAKRTIHGKSSQSPKNIGKNVLRINSNNDFETISPIKTAKGKSNEENIKSFLSPIKVFESNNSASGVVIQKKLVNHIGINLSSQDLDEGLIRVGGNKDTFQIKQTANFGQALTSEKEKQLINKAQKLQQICEAQKKQKDGQIAELKKKAQKDKSQGDQLMMMLLLQAFSIEQFIKEQRQEEQNSMNFRNYYSKDYIHG